MKSKSSFYRDLWAIVLPISVQSLVSSSVGASDALMLGFTVMWVLSTMIKTWDDSVVYSVDDGTVAQLAFSQPYQVVDLTAHGRRVEVHDV